MASILPQLGILSGELVDRKRFEEGSYVGGRFVEGQRYNVIQIPASVQPARGKDFQETRKGLDGSRLKDMIVVYCDSEVFRAADDKNNITADRVVYLGEDYEVLVVSHRRGRHLRHDKILAIRESKR